MANAALVVRRISADAERQVQTLIDEVGAHLWAEPTPGFERPPNWDALRGLLTTVSGFQIHVCEAVAELELAHVLRDERRLRQAADDAVNAAETSLRDLRHVDAEGAWTAVALLGWSRRSPEVRSQAWPLLLVSTWIPTRQGRTTWRFGWQPMVSLLAWRPWQARTTSDAPTCASLSGSRPAWRPGDSPPSWTRRR